MEAETEASSVPGKAEPHSEVFGDTGTQSAADAEPNDAEAQSAGVGNEVLGKIEALDQQVDREFVASVVLGWPIWGRT